MTNVFISLYAPNGTFGCLWLHAYRLDVTIAFTRELLGGFDVSWRDRFVFTTQPM